MKPSQQRKIVEKFKFTPPPYFVPTDLVRLLHRHYRTILKYVLEGRLHTYRIPGYRGRRITRGDLIDFLLNEREYGLLRRLSHTPAPMILAVPKQLGLALLDRLSLGSCWPANEWEAGIQFRVKHPAAFIIGLWDFELGARMARAIRESVPGRPIIGVQPNVDVNDLYYRMDFDTLLRDPTADEIVAALPFRAESIWYNPDDVRRRYERTLMRLDGRWKRILRAERPRKGFAYFEAYFENRLPPNTPPDAPIF